MGLLNIFRRKETRERVLAAGVPFAWKDSVEVGDRSRHAAYLSCNHGWVYVCVGHIAHAVASRPLRVYRRGVPIADSGRRIEVADRRRLMEFAGTVAAKALETEEDVTEVPNHPLANLIERPSPDTTGYDWLYQTQSYLELCGVAPWFLNGAASGTLVGVENLLPQYFSLHTEGGRIAVYLYGSEQDRKQLKPQEVAYVRDRNPTNPLKGMGRLEACLRTVRLSESVEIFKQSYIDRGAQPGMLVIAKSARTQKEVDQIKSEFARLYDGPKKAGRTMVLGGDIATQPWAGDKELPYVLSEEANRDKISAVFGVPKAMLTTDDVNLANGKVAAPHFQLLTVSPRCKRLEDWINLEVASWFGPDVFVAFDPPIGVDEQAEETRVRDNYTAGLLTLNEARCALQYPKVSGGDEFKADSMGFGGGEVFPTIEGEAAAQPTGTRLLEARPTSIKCSRHTFAGEESFARKVDKDALGLLQEAERKLAAALAQVLRGIPIGPGGVGMAAGAQLEKAMADALMLHLTDLFKRGLDQAVGGVGDPFNIKPDEALKRLEAYVIRFASSRRQTFEEQIRGAIVEGVNAGENQQQINERVRAMQDNMSAFDAERIARTEVSRAYMGGRATGWEMSGVVTGKKWVLSREPCELCIALAERHKEGIALNKPFAALGESITAASGTSYTMDYSEIDTPPVHPQCRCSMEPILRSDTE